MLPSLLDVNRDLERRRPATKLRERSFCCFHGARLTCRLSLQELVSDGGVRRRCVFSIGGGGQPVKYCIPIEPACIGARPEPATQ